MADQLVLAGFVAVTLLLAVLTARFFRRAAGRTAARNALLVGNLLVTLTLLMALVTAGEVYFRFVYDATDSFGLTRTTRRWLERHYRRNALGFRDSREYALARGERPRVTFVGDSFTAGHGVAEVEQRFSNRLAAARPDLEVHTLAVNGVETGEQVGILRRALARGYQLDAVVLVYCLNDIADLIPEWRRILGRVQELHDLPFLLQHSDLLNTLYFRLTLPRDPDFARYFEFVEEHYRGPAWQTQRGRLRELQEVVEQHGGRLLAVTFPFLQGLGPEYRLDHAHRRLARHWQEAGVPHLDLREAFAGHAPEDLVVNALDAHPNEFAHGLAASAIDAFLRTQNATGSHE